MSKINTFNKQNQHIFKKTYKLKLFKTKFSSEFNLNLKKKIENNRESKMINSFRLNDKMSLAL